MKLAALIGDYQADVQIRTEDSRVTAAIDGREYELEAHKSGACGYLLVCDGHVFDCHVEGRPESGEAIDVVLGTTHYAVTLMDPKRLRGASSMGAHGDDAARVIAPMPGKVVRVLVELGARVETGAGIVVVEAMKMQNEMKSPKAGTVVALNFQAGATVNGGDVLAIVE